MTLTDLAEATGLSRATVRRFVHTLVHLGYVRASEKHFALTPKIMNLGFAYLASQPLVELVERERDPTRDEYLPAMETSGDEDEMEPGEEEIGIAIPGMLAGLGVALVATTLVLAGMPPLPGFVGKVAILHSLFASASASAGDIPVSTWVVTAILIISGLAVLVALTRVGVNEIWARAEDEIPPVRMTDFGAVVFLIVICLGMTVRGGPIMRYMEDTAHSLQTRDQYLENVLEPDPVEIPVEVGP